MDGRGGLGVGALSWSSVLAGARDAARVFEVDLSGDDVPKLIEMAEGYVAGALPGLGPEDRRVLAMGWAGYPHSSELILTLGQTEDVLAEAPVPGEVTELRIAGRWHPERVERAYPELAEYLQDLGDLAEIKVALHDAAGRELLKGHTDTEHVRAGLQAFVKDGSSCRRRTVLRSWVRSRLRADAGAIRHALRGLRGPSLRGRPAGRLSYEERPTGATNQRSATRGAWRQGRRQRLRAVPDRHARTCSSPATWRG